MRKISADYIFTISSEPIKNGVVVIDDDETILEVTKGDPELRNTKHDPEIEYYKGIICPGFINTHCHLELSHLRSKIPENIGMPGFIKEIISIRSDFSDKQIQDAIVEGEEEMIKNGIVAVGDISNNDSTFRQKEKGNLFYHTFIEVFDLNPDKAGEVYEKAIALKKQHQQLETLSFKLSSSIVPHAPYTVSEKLLKLINTNASEKNSILSIHNQESEAENELFISKSGEIFDTFKNMGINTDLLRQTGFNSLKSTLPFLNFASKILLVHNTFTSREDISWAEKQIRNQESRIKNQEQKSKIQDPRSQILFWCTCPNANMYIENKLPNYNYFIEENVRVTIGTDSLASNRTLSILDELKTIVKQYPEIPLQTLLLWATKNGADFLGFTQLGSIEKGKKPGLNLLKNIDELKITEKTEVLKLV
ncbi:MAG: amidohydrolase family protein [Bacteroidia bacterium]|nr:amidohydrolase family protein [Bacteroidia bacterium]